MGARLRGITELSETSLRAFFASDAPELRAAFDPYGARWEQVEERDWVAVAHARLEPMLVGERFFLVPVWRDDPAPAGRMRIVVNPGMAFGTGAHETTQLCIEALERRLRPGAAVLDVGTGSGFSRLPRGCSGPDAWSPAISIPRRWMWRACTCPHSSARWMPRRPPAPICWW